MENGELKEETVSLTGEQTTPSGEGSSTEEQLRSVLNDKTMSASALPNARWIENFLGVLVAPRSTFQRMYCENANILTGFPQALGTVCLVFAAEGLKTTTLTEPYMALLKVPGAIIGGLCYWLALVGLFALVGTCFNVSKQCLRSASVSLGWSFLPWLFVAPIACYQNLLGPAYILLLALPLVWIFVLQIIAINESFRFKAWQTLSLFLVVPTLIGFIQFLQFFQALCAVIGSIV